MKNSKKEKNKEKTGSEQAVNPVYWMARPVSQKRGKKAKKAKNDNMPVESSMLMI